MKIKSNDKIKREFSQAVTVLVLMYGCTIWTLTKRLKRKLDLNSKMILFAVLNKSWKQSLRKQCRTATYLPSHKSPKKNEQDMQGIDTPVLANQQNLHLSRLCRHWVPSRGRPVKSDQLEKLMVVENQGNLCNQCDLMTCGRLRCVTLYHKQETIPYLIYNRMIKIGFLFSSVKCTNCVGI